MKGIVSTHNNIFQKGIPPTKKERPQEPQKNRKKDGHGNKNMAVYKKNLGAEEGEKPSGFFLGDCAWGEGGDPKSKNCVRWQEETSGQRKTISRQKRRTRTPSPWIQTYEKGGLALLQRKLVGKDGELIKGTPRKH